MPSVERFQLRLGAEDRTVELRRHARARRFTLRVKPGTGEIVLTVPVWARAAEARAFAQRHTSWVEKRLASADLRRAFAPGIVVPLRGEAHVVVHRPEARGVVWTERGAAGPEIHVAGDAAFLERRLLDFLKAEARKDFAHAVPVHAGKLGLVVKRIAVRDQTTRWGSCSASGVLSFSWRLVLAPPFVLDYLAAHEVAHLAEMNHGPKFWRLVKELCPDMDRAKAWMRAEGATLHAFGPVAGGRSAPDPDAI
jgi:hypothetical protein